MLSVSKITPKLPLSATQLILTERHTEFLLGAFPWGYLPLSYIFLETNGENHSEKRSLLPTFRLSWVHYLSLNYTISAQEGSPDLTPPLVVKGRNPSHTHTPRPKKKCPCLGLRWSSEKLCAFLRAVVSRCGRGSTEWVVCALVIYRCLSATGVCLFAWLQEDTGFALTPVVD